jgi:hypothetical protein
MKITSLFAVLLLLVIGSCKKDTSSPAQAAVFAFDFNGQHHSFNLDTLQLQVIDTGLTKGKYLTFYPGNASLPKVIFTLTDRSPGYSTNCFSTGPYPGLAANPLCHDSVPSNFCVGFYMQYTDTGIGSVGLYSATDSTSSLILTSCSGGTNGNPAVINATFHCTLTDSTGFISSKQVTNGTLSYVNYTHK